MCDGASLAGASAMESVYILSAVIATQPQYRTTRFRILLFIYDTLQILYLSAR